MLDAFIAWPPEVSGDVISSDVGLVRRRGLRGVPDVCTSLLLTFSVPRRSAKLLAEPGAGIDQVRLDVTVGVPRDLHGPGLHLSDGAVHVGAIGQEEVTFPTVSITALSRSDSAWGEHFIDHEAQVWVRSMTTGG